MDFFRSAKDFLFPKSTSLNPYGLSDADVKRIEILLNTDEWEVYEKALAAVVSLYSESLLSSQDSYHDTLSKGVLLGLRKASTLVAEIVLHNKERAQQNERSRNTGTSAAIRNAALFGTPFFGRPARSNPSQR